MAAKKRRDPTSWLGGMFRFQLAAVPLGALFAQTNPQARNAPATAANIVSDPRGNSGVTTQSLPQLLDVEIAEVEGEVVVVVVITAEVQSHDMVEDED